MGDTAAGAIEGMIRSADNRTAGIIASVVGVVALIVTATGVFGEVQSSMNAIWKAKPGSPTFGRLVRARAVSLGLVLTCGFLLMVSLAVSAGLQALYIPPGTVSRRRPCPSRARFRRFRRAHLQHIRGDLQGVARCGDRLARRGGRRGGHDAAVHGRQVSHRALYEPSSIAATRASAIALRMAALPFSKAIPAGERSTLGTSPFTSSTLGLTREI